MRIGISIDCVDDTHRIPKGFTFMWEIKPTDNLVSRDARMRSVAKLLIATMRQNYPSLLKKKKIDSKVQEGK
jgi:hypothetical protein